MEQNDWRKSVVYQIYPKSFNDTTGSGEGDIQGIIEKLDYLQYLGVDYLWLTPVYESPMNDNGYDISNYYKINERFGTIEDLKTLIAKAHQRNLKIMMDIVINHTSTDHEWFKKAYEDQESPYRDYYFFRRSADNKPPTNWESKFGGNAWKYDPKTESYYLHLFDVTQADLNWDNPEVRKALYDIINYWIDFGVDGFRFDVINLISKGEFKDSQYIGKEFYTDGPRVHEYLHEMNQHTFGNREMMTVGEMSSTTIEDCIKYSNPERQELSSVFNFHHLKVDYVNGEKWTNAKLDFHKLKEILMEWQLGIFDGNGWNAIFWCNHDQPRVVSRFGDDSTPHNHRESAKMLATVLHMLQGTPYIYQGEEIGMTDPHFNDINQYRDVESLNAYDNMKERGFEESEILEILGQKSRDNSRTPVQWSNLENAGFTTGQPWIDIPENYHSINVEAAINDENSVLHTYRKLIQLRHEHDIVTYGSIEPLHMEHDKLFIYKRHYNEETWLIIANFSKQSCEIPADINLEGEVMITNGTITGNQITGFGSIVIQQ
ncbi:alpha,alpha-phosphotrehalase [Staphylococcus gallinarum]|jgi:trehalose-6-phosphate hydrolase|uniref:alpha,alpha-phosphotrehalase n=1 Tax=Staphylococcus TaxID=1279 RepID=UPI000D1F58DB|nr:alpha,alpha-phosphotrehalase [Staphylococcus gallinarum]MCD8820848.1 alpha,alpha-phosphotrehalase [Staphylococcus gallinarum]PTL07392.1 alpha,alpha-phosphotrehalase [Staphylococcus gallinarum]PTL09563.1 alpha,alpha-phosphotrehalase [Staphylococcus gallinarum]RIO76234.1 alpha,alpha-phosphotrehalase [Staphylococcus gallinarum]RIO82728.1 alpha,alpha-phosphotrehalase [Staphylococcus gallinarum]